MLRPPEQRKQLCNLQVVFRRWQVDESHGRKDFVRIDSTNWGTVARGRGWLSCLSQSNGITAIHDRKGKNYPKFLPESTVLAMLFFELRSADQRDMEALNLIRGVQFRRPFYGAVILRGEGNHPDGTALVGHYHSDVPHPEMTGPKGLLDGMSRPRLQSCSRKILARS